MRIWPLPLHPHPPRDAKPPKELVMQVYNVLEGDWMAGMTCKVSKQSNVAGCAGVHNKLQNFHHGLGNLIRKTAFEFFFPSDVGKKLYKSTHMMVFCVSWRTKMMKGKGGRHSTYVCGDVRLIWECRSVAPGTTLPSKWCVGHIFRLPSRVKFASWNGRQESHDALIIRMPYTVQLFDDVPWQLLSQWHIFGWI